ncbi:MAG: peptidoglycan DD-metalloendopeptidase family protein [Tahibacter sp.]
MHAPRLLFFPAALLVFSICHPAFAKKIYKYTDSGGVVHFTDQQPPDGQPAQETQVRVERQSFVSLRIEGQSGQRQARAFNHLSGPAQVELSLSGAVNVVTEPPLPLTVVLAANEERVLAQFEQTDRDRAGQFELLIRAMPGDPQGSADDFAYRWPLAGRDARISQGFNGHFSHTDEESRYAVDIGTEEGTDVLAARDGIVMQVEDDYYGSGLDREKFGGRANLVRILHNDGSMAVYAHLRLESVCVRAGAHVYAGQKLGESGNTGYSTGPHLHFAIQLNRGFRLESVPFHLLDAEGSEIPVARIASAGVSAPAASLRGR